MLKKILLFIVFLVIAVYVVLALTTLNAKPVDRVCQGVSLVIKDSINAGFVTQAEVLNMLKKGNISPVGGNMKEIELKPLEETLRKHPLIDQVECYKTPGNRIFVEVTQRIPLFRVITAKGENYYVDNKGAILPPEAKCVAHLPVVTGYVEKSFALTDLYQFALFLQNNPFWNAQIQQINVLRNNEIELVPRVGDHIVFLGKLNHYESKLNRLQKFYKKGLNKVGWNKYKRISLEFNNQIICTKR